MKYRRLLTVTTLFFLLQLGACSLIEPRLSERNLDAGLEFVAPENHSQLHSPVHVEARLHDLQLAPNDETGVVKMHIHVLINRPVPDLDRKIPVQEEGVMVFESGKSSIHVSLPPGTHKLQLIAADEWSRAHIPPLISEIRTIKVVE